MEYIGNILYDRKLLEKEEDVVIFGAGKYGRKLLYYLELNKKSKKISCFCDSDISQCGHTVAGIPILAPEEALQRYPEAAWLVSGKYAEEMYDTLHRHNVHNIHFLFL